MSASCRRRSSSLASTWSSALRPLNGITISAVSSVAAAAGERFTSIARLRTIVAIQVIGAARGIEARGVAPDADVGFLQDVLGEVAPAQHGERDAEQLAPGQVVEFGEGGLVFAAVAAIRRTSVSGHGLFDGRTAHGQLLRVPRPFAGSSGGRLEVDEQMTYTVH